MISKRIRSVAMAAILTLLPAAAAGAGNPAKGKVLYQSQCAVCHGATGQGDGPGAAGMEPKPTNLSDKAQMAKYSDRHIAEALKKGGAAVGESPLMAAFGGSMSDADIADVVAFTRSMSK